MWFAKWFGGRKDDSEPAAHPPHPAARPTRAQPDSVRPRTSSASASGSAKKQASKGFDPYNSGTFDKNKAWERVIR
jgi:hypothetical protein